MDEMPSIKKVYSGAFYNNCTGNRALLMQHAGLSGYQDPEQKENHEHAEHLSNQPAIARYSRPVLQQLSLGALHVVYYILRICVDPLNHLALF